MESGLYAAPLLVSSDLRRKTARAERTNSLTQREVSPARKAIRTSSLASGSFSGTTAIPLTRCVCGRHGAVVLLAPEHHLRA
jgi:hypothetical protein